MGGLGGQTPIGFSEKNIFQRKIQKKLTIFVLLTEGKIIFSIVLPLDTPFKPVDPLVGGQNMTKAAKIWM